MQNNQGQQQTAQASTGQPNTTNSQFGEFGGNEAYGGARLDYSKPKYNDLIWMILFYVHIVVLIVVMIVLFLSQPSSSSSTPAPTTSSSSTQASTTSVGGSVVAAVFVSLLVGAITGVLVGLLWLQLMKLYAMQIIKGMLFFNMLCWAVVIVLGLIIPTTALVVVGVLGLLMICLYSWCVWSRIPFSSVLLSLASSIAQTYEGTIYVSLLTCVLDLIWYVVWIMAYIAYVMSVDTPNNLVTFLYIVSLYWGFYVFKNVSHTTTCGVAATWFFSANPMSPSKAAFKRTMTTSFGSVCLGSLLVAILQALRSILKGFGKRSCLGCLVVCLLYCIQRLIQFFNKFAFAQVAIYGSTFFDAAKATWNLFKSKGMDAIIASDLTGLPLFCGAFFGWIISSIASYFVALAICNDMAISLILCLYSGVVGYGLCVLVLLTVRSAVTALFVCFAEDPNALQRTHPTDFQRLVQAHTGMMMISQGMVYDPAQQAQAQAQPQAQPQGTATR